MEMYFAAVICIVVMILIAKLAIWMNNPASVGRRGENTVERALLRLSNDARVLKNLSIPFGDNSTEIDIVYISQSGIFVIEVKNYGGWIFGNEKSKNWMAIHFQNRYSFYNPIKQNKIHIDCLKKLINRKVNYYNIVVFSNRCEFKELTVTSKDVHVINYIDLYELISFLNYNSTTKMTDDEVISIYNELSNYTVNKVDKEIINKHNQYVQNKKYAI